MVDRVGFIDAYQDKKYLHKCFIPTSCYYASESSDNNFICGRRGTGKSAIVINLMNNGDYQYKDTVEGPEFYQQFVRSMQSTDLEDLDPKYLFETIWRHLIISTAMNAVITKKYKSGYSYISVNDSPIYEYLKKIEFLGKKPLSMWQRTIKALKATIKGYGNKPDFLSRLMSEVSGLLENEDFNIAEASLLKHLNNSGRCLIIIDTILDYFNKENLFKSCVVGLINAVLSLTCGRYTENLEVKCCIPGELYPQIEMWEKSKVKDHLVPLEWSTKDLLRMISKRMFYHMVLEKIESEERFTIIEWNNYNTVIRTVWDRFFPNSIRNMRNQKEQTHVYILRHTQHTPREIIRIVNSIFSEITTSDIGADLDSRIIRRAIVKGVHQSCIDTADELIGSNQFIIPNLRQIISTSFQGKPKVMHISDARKWVSNSKKYWKLNNSKYMEEDLVIHDLFSIGFLGSVDGYKAKGYALKTIFSYTGGNLGLSKDCYLAIHPLFHDTFNINRTVNNKFIYPTSILREYLLDSNGSVIQDPSC